MSRRRTLLSRVCAFALAALLAASSALAQQSADAALARAREMLAAGRLYPAEQAARDAISREPDRADAHRLLGQILLRRGRPEQAVAELERAAALAPGDPGLARELAAAREQVSRREGLSRREAERRAQAPTGRPTDLPSRTDPEKPWQLAAGAGLFHESNVRQSAVDQESGNADGAGQFDFTASYELPVRNWFDLSAGYDFYQSLYFDETDFDLQSHTLRALASRDLGPTNGALSYFYSLNTLGGSRFLDLQELRPSLGYSPTPWWYSSVSPGVRLKRFDGDSDRNADTPLVGVQQLFALGSWKRRLLLGIDGEFEDTKSREFDYRGFAAVADLLSPIPISIGARSPVFDLRYRFRYRDYTSELSSPTGERQDRIHTARARLDVPLVTYVSLRIEYEYEHASSDVESADYDDHIVGGSLRVEL
jgi:hypothetical protein